MKKLFGKFACLLFLFMVSPMLSEAKVHDKLLSPGNTEMEFETRTLADSALKSYMELYLGRKIVTWPLESWDFPALTVAAFYYHPELDVARAQCRTAKAAIGVAGSSPNPLFQANPRYSVNPQPTKSPRYLELYSGFVLETGGKRRHRLEQARHSAESSCLSIPQSAWQVRSRLKTHLLSLLLQERRTLIVQRQLASQQNRQQAFEHRLALHEATESDVAQVRIQQEQTLLQFRDTDRLYQEERVQTAQAIGIPVEALQGITFSSDWLDKPTLLPQFENLSRLEFRQMALQQRSDIKSLLADYAASQAALALAVSRQYPDIRLGPGYLWNQGQYFWALPNTVFFANYFNSRGSIKEAKAKRDEIANRFSALQAQVIGEVDQAYASYQNASQELLVANTLFTDQVARQELIQKQFAAGEVDRPTLRLSEVELEAARLSQLNIVEKAQQSLALLENALQSSLGSEMVFIPVNQSSKASPILEKNPRGANDP